MEFGFGVFFDFSLETSYPVAKFQFNHFHHWTQSKSHTQINGVYAKFEKHEVEMCVIAMY